ncbi:unnamed protein product [Acanthoscelides obtectus]|uniref:Uncharacterized protein n=3 Tax=Acanthoscelides obtectus TaxID=200917 RepID=A0A9P0KGZ9_ACAOB|nr:unnamed protein product [Acanthoscelides obtectus]CAK1644759.1 hypothetical protein AOBTE_LOCUS13933 [Acanthoscelides obtectus]
MSDISKYPCLAAASAPYLSPGDSAPIPMCSWIYQWGADKDWTQYKPSKTMMHTIGNAQKQQWISNRIHPDRGCGSCYTKSRLRNYSPPTPQKPALEHLIPAKTGGSQYTGVCYSNQYIESTCRYYSITNELTSVTEPSIRSYLSPPCYCNLQKTQFRPQKAKVEPLMPAVTGDRGYSRNCSKRCTKNTCSFYNNKNQLKSKTEPCIRNTIRESNPQKPKVEPLKTAVASKCQYSGNCSKQRSKKTEPSLPAASSDRKNIISRSENVILPYEYRRNPKPQAELRKTQSDVSTWTCNNKSGTHTDGELHCDKQMSTGPTQDCIQHQYYQVPCCKCGKFHYQQQTIVCGSINRNELPERDNMAKIRRDSSYCGCHDGNRSCINRKDPKKCSCACTCNILMPPSESCVSQCPVKESCTQSETGVVYVDQEVMANPKVENREVLAYSMHQKSSMDQASSRHQTTNIRSQPSKEQMTMTETYSREEMVMTGDPFAVRSLCQGRSTPCCPCPNGASIEEEPAPPRRITPCMLGPFPCQQLESRSAVRMKSTSSQAMPLGLQYRIGLVRNFFQGAIFTNARAQACMQRMFKTRRKKVLLRRRNV